MVLIRYNFLRWSKTALTLLSCWHVQTCHWRNYFIIQLVKAVSKNNALRMIFCDWHLYDLSLWIIQRIQCSSSLWSHLSFTMCSFSNILNFRHACIFSNVIYCFSVIWWIYVGDKLVLSFETIVFFLNSNRDHQNSIVLNVQDLERIS